MLAVSRSAINAVSLLAALLPTVAVTIIFPATVLVSVVLALPSSPVVTTAGANVTPVLSAVNVTSAFATGLPCASVTSATTALPACPSAFAPEVTLRLLSVILAESWSAIKCVVVSVELPDSRIDALTLYSPAV